MVQLKRNTTTVIADPSPGPSSSSLHPSSLDRRLKAIRSCSSWNNALLNGRRTRGPQWDYATASYHVSKDSPEYYKGLTPLESNPPAGSNPSTTSNHYGTSSSSQFSAGLPPRATLNAQSLDRHPQQLHALDQFSNRTMRNTSQASQTSSHGRAMGNPAPPANYSLHPGHMQPVGNHVVIPPQSFNNNLPNPMMISSNLADPKSAMFSAQGPNIVNPSNIVHGSNMITSPHFQSGVPPGANHGIPRHMSTTPSLPPSQSERKDAMLSHSASYHHSTPLNQYPINPPPTSQLGPPSQSFSPAQHHPPPSSFEKTPADGMASPTHPQAIRSPASHGMEQQIPGSNRKFHPIPSPSMHTFSQRPMTPQSAQTLAPTGGATHPAHQVFQPIHVGYQSSGNGLPPISISSQARNLHYTHPGQSNLNNNPKPPGGAHPQVLQAPVLPSQPPPLSNEAPQFNPLAQFQSQLSPLINTPGPPPLMNHNNPANPNAPLNRPLPPNFNPPQFYQQSMIPPPGNPVAGNSNSYSNTGSNQ